MPLDKRKDRRQIALEREIAEFEKYIKKAKDEKEKTFRIQQLAKAKAALAKYLQNKPE